jgi:hypothetical protein
MIISYGSNLQQIKYQKIKLEKKLITQNDLKKLKGEKKIN